MVVIPNSAKYLSDERAWTKYCDQLWEDRMSPSKGPAKYPCWVDRADTYAGPVLDVTVLYFMYPQELVINPLEWKQVGKHQKADGLYCDYWLEVRDDGVFVETKDDMGIYGPSEIVSTMEEAKERCWAEYKLCVLEVLSNHTNYKHNV